MKTSIFAFRLSPRLQPSVWAERISPIVALVLTVALAALLFSLQGAAPVAGVVSLVFTPVSTVAGISEVLLKACPLCITALGLAVSFRANVNNIGAEGQVILGGIGATAVALYLPSDITAWLAIPAVLLSGMVGGMTWAGIPAFLRTKFKANETLTSLLLVYVAVQALSWLTNGPWRDPAGMNFPETALFNSNVTLPKLVDIGWSFWEGTRVNITLFVAFFAALVTHLFIDKSRIGYELLVAGQSAKAAAYAGVSSKLAVWVAFLYSGAAAGLAGAVEVTGSLGQLQAGWTPGYGFTAIVAAFLGRLRPIPIGMSAILLALIDSGGLNLQMELGLPAAMSSLIQGVLLLSILGVDLFVRYGINRNE